MDCDVGAKYPGEVKIAGGLRMPHNSPEPVNSDDGRLGMRLMIRRPMRGALWIAKSIGYEAMRDQLDFFSAATAKNTAASATSSARDIILVYIPRSISPMDSWRRAAADAVGLISDTYLSHSGRAVSG